MTRQRRRPLSGPGFTALVAAVAIVVFVLVLRWPGTSLVHTAASVTPPSRATLVCEVAYVNDGDTLRCADGTRIRLHAVAARESDETCSPGHPCPSASAASATRELRKLADGQRLQCEPTGNSYNRVTAICWNEAVVEINCAMVRSGTALVWDRFYREAPICRRRN